MQHGFKSPVINRLREGFLASSARSFAGGFFKLARHYNNVTPKRSTALFKFPAQENPQTLFLSSRRQLSSRNSQWPMPANRPRHPSGKMQVTPAGYKRFGQNTNRAAGRSPLSRYILMFCSGGMVYYIYRNIDYAPFTGRIRFIGGVTRESELSLGRQAFEDLVNNFQGRVLPARHPVTQRVRKVVRRLARTVRSMDSGLCEDFEWMVAVADVPEPNAMCAPGGRILVTTGLLEILDNDDELAVILGHEITHALNRHGVETLSLRRIMWPLIFLINQIFDLRFLPSVFATMFLTLPYSRKLEYEADEVGLMICVEACYNPKVGPGVFRRLDQVQKDVGGSSGTKIGSWFSTHPHSLDRAKKLEKDMPKRVSRFEQHCPSSATGLKGFAENFGRDWA